MMMNATAAVRLCDELLDFCEGWNPLDVEGSPEDLTIRVSSIRETVTRSGAVTPRQADYLLGLYCWLHRISRLKGHVQVEFLAQRERLRLSPLG
jgi:hypothetical protein